MSFESIATTEGFLGAAIGDSAQWRPAPAVKLEARDGETFLLWSWSKIAAEDEVPSETSSSQQFFTLPHPIHRSVIERAQRNPARQVIRPALTV